MRAYVILLCLGLAHCLDPVHEQAASALGPEDRAVPVGPLHRAGQPCLTCHGGDGPANLELSVAGTIYQREKETAPAVEIGVVVRDARGGERRAVTNAAGNFFVTRSQWNPIYPLRVELEVGARRIAMQTEIPRDGSCNTCHRGSGGSRTMPGVFVEAAP